MTHLFKTLALTLGMQLPALAQAVDWQGPLNSVTEHIVKQGYQDYAQSAQALKNSIDQLCAVPSTSTLSQAQNDFRQNALDWQQIQWLNFGPVTYFMRYYAFEYWPDKKGVTQRQLRSLSQTPEKMQEPKFWHSASIAVRGLTAVESLLFHPDFTPADNTDHCHLLTEVAEHHRETTQAVAQEWQNTTPESWVFAEEDSDFNPSQAAFEQYLQQWVEHMSAVKDAKLETPIGYNSHGNLKLAEFYRSGLSLKAIQENLKTYRELYHKGQPSLYDIAMEEQPELGQALEGSLKNSVTIALQLPKEYFQPGMSQAERIELAKPLVSSISESQRTLVSLMTSLGFQIGFNSRDGD
ncbi:imelysin family protein [Marinomonas epiphytica]